jgi:hypothetical protein
MKNLANFEPEYIQDSPMVTAFKANQDKQKRIVAQRIRLFSDFQEENNRRTGKGGTVEIF